MGFGKKESNIISNAITDPKKILVEALKKTSGSGLPHYTKYNLFYQVYGFKGVKDGVGCSTIVANTALALAKLGLTVCVLDTSILAPCQDELLQTNMRTKSEKDKADWFDMGYTTKSALSVSSLNSKISVLSFQNRTIIDLLSTSDSENLVEFALSQVVTKFDVVLMDICSETTAISMGCMQQCQQIIQVWSGTSHVLRNVNSFITNNTICSCVLDKMRYVVTNLIVEDIPTKWESVLNEYRMEHLASFNLSYDIARILAMGKPVFDFASMSDDVRKFNEGILDIVSLIVELAPDSMESAVVMPEIIDGRNRLAEGGTEQALMEDYPDRSRAIKSSVDLYNDEHKIEKTDAEQYKANYSSAEDIDIFDTEDTQQVEVKKKAGLFSKGGRN